MRFAQRSFSAGELSPQTYGRVDAPYYYAGARIMENYIPLPTGSVIRRPGMLSLMKLKSPGGRVYVVTTSSKDSYLLIIYQDKLSCYYIENKEYPDVPLYYDNTYGSINDLLGITDVPWKKTPLEDINISIVGLEVYITHYSFPPIVISFKLKVIRAGTPSVFFNEFNPRKTDGYKIGDFVNYQRQTYAATRDIKGYVSGGAFVVNPFGGVEAWEDVGEAFTTLPNTWVSGATGTVVYNGYYWTYWTDTDGSNVGLAILSFFTFGIAGQINRAQRMHEIRNAQNAERALGSPPHESKIGRWRRGAKALSQNALPWAVNTKYAKGYKVRYNGRLYQARVDHTSTASQEPDKDVAWRVVGPTPLFQESGRYPHIILGYEGRLMCFGCEDSPSIIWGSQTGEALNFSGGLKDSDAFIIKIDGEGDNLIEWVSDVSGLTIGTSSGEWRLTGAQGGPLTPTSAQALRQSKVGSYGGVILFNNMLLFLDRTRKNIRQFVFSDNTRSYLVPKVSELNNHLFEPGVRSWAVQHNPYTILWCVMNDGTLVSGTYMGESISFAKHSSEIPDFGPVEYCDVTINYRPSGDQVFFATKNILVMLAPIHQGQNFAYLDYSESLQINSALNITGDSVPASLGSNVFAMATDGYSAVAITHSAILRKRLDKDEWREYAFGTDRVRYDTVLSRYSAITYFADRDIFVVSGNNTGLIGLDPTSMNMEILSRETTGYNILNKFYEADQYLVCYGTSSGSSIAVPARSNSAVTVMRGIQGIAYSELMDWVLTYSNTIQISSDFPSNTDTSSASPRSGYASYLFKGENDIVYFLDTQNARDQKVYVVYANGSTILYSRITDVPRAIFQIEHIAGHYVFFTDTHVYIRETLGNRNNVSWEINAGSGLGPERIFVDRDNGIFFFGANDTVFRVDVARIQISKSKITRGPIGAIGVSGGQDISSETIVVANTHGELFGSDGQLTQYVESNIHRLSGAADAMIDDNLIEDFSYQSTGRYVVPKGTTRLYTGNPYTSTLQPQAYTPDDGKFDTDIRVARMGVTVHDTKGLKIGVSQWDLDNAIENNVPITGGEVPKLYTGELTAVVDHRYNGPWPRIVQDKPFPGEIQGVTYEIQGGRS